MHLTTLPIYRDFMSLLYFYFYLFNSDKTISFYVDIKYFLHENKILYLGESTVLEFYVFIFLTIIIWFMMAV